MKKIKQFTIGTMVIGFFLIVVCIMNYATSLYSLDGECLITETGRTILLDERGHTWEIGQKDFQTGDRVRIKFSDNLTPDNISDDIVINAYVK